MEPQRWKEIDGIFAAALERDPAERPGFLAVACGSDAKLRAEVESLLSAHQAAGSFIDGSASDVAASLLGKDPMGRAQLGQYKIEKAPRLERHGAGLSRTTGWVVRSRSNS